MTRLVMLPVQHKQKGEYMPPDEPNEEEALEELPEDNGTPFSQPDPGRNDPGDNDITREIEEPARHSDIYPQTDVNPDKTELYQEGVDVTEPNAGNAVEGYDPAKDQRRQSQSG